MRARILHISYSMATGGGPITIKRLVEDFPEYDHYISGNKGVYMEYFSGKMGDDHLLYLFGKNLIYNLFLLVRFCRLNKIDVVHVHGRGAASFGRFIKVFRPKIRMIYTPNGFFPDSLKSPMKQMYVLGERVLLPLTDKVFFVSLSEQTTFARSLKIKGTDKFVYIQNYINPNSDNYAVVGDYRHVSQRPKRLLFIGRLSPQKGIDILVDAVAKLQDDRLHITMVGTGEMEEFLKKAISDAKLEQMLTYIGKMDQAYRIMPHFDALVLPARFEGLPFTILEAMWFKLPLIVTPANGIIDVLDSKNSYMATGINADAFAEAIRLFLQDSYTRPQKLEKMTSDNYDLLVRQYSWTAVKDKVTRLYAN